MEEKIITKKELEKLVSSIELTPEQEAEFTNGKGVENE